MCLDARWEKPDGRTLPRCRAKRLHVVTLSEETVVYETWPHKLHYLDHLASVVWLRSDGGTTRPAMVADLRHQVAVSADVRLVQSKGSRASRAFGGRLVASGGGRCSADPAESARLLARYGISTA